MLSNRIVRLYSLLIDGTPHSQSFEHDPALSADKLNGDLNRRFHEWLESFTPGAYEANRVTGICFSDLPWFA
ncbi:MAG TPA: hypothetical protein VG796_07000 [Verrucomicrobiales bacterium]|nr:hypothetical protein [Verrucomicrobiales bacterium]